MRNEVRTHLDTIGGSLTELIALTDVLTEENDRFLIDHKHTSLLLTEALLKIERAKIHMRKRKRVIVPSVKPE